MQVDIKKLDKDLPTPVYKHSGDAGMDVYSTLDYTLQAGERKLVPTGLSFAVPYGFELQIRPRSGLAFKHGISIVNTPGTLDHQYRGELGVVLINHGKEAFELKRGERIAQIVFNKIEIVSLREVENLSGTQRGAGGFGSTGMK